MAETLLHFISSSSRYILSFIVLVLSFWTANKVPRFISTFLIHFNIAILLPFAVGDPLSLLFISAPSLAIYYYFMYRIAEVIVPSADKGDKKERRNQIKAFFWYLWGMQYPVWVTTDGAGSEIEERIHGDATNPVGGPGIICADSHHAIVISNQFDEITRVDGPGVVFTERGERPSKIIDLRAQARNREIQALTKDGVPLKARLITPFSIDEQSWSDELYRKLYASNPRLANAQNLDHAKGAYPFSSKRVRAVLKFGDQYSPSNRQFKKNNLGETVLDRVQPIARRVLKQYNLNDLWEPPSGDTHAFDKISDEIYDKASNLLRKHGIRLRASRIVDFRFEDSTTPNQKLDVWAKNRRAKAHEITEAAKSEVAFELEVVRAEMEQIKSATFKESEIREPEKDKMLGILRQIIRLEDLAKSKSNQDHDDTKNIESSEEDIPLSFLAEQIKGIILPEILQKIKSALDKSEEEQG